MDIITITAGMGFLLLAIGFGIVFARLISGDRFIVPAEEGDAIFCPSRYRVMEHLLDEADQKLAECAGDREAERKIGKLRIRILRGYMQQLSEDFNRICKASKSMMVHSEVDRPDIAGSLMRQQLTFSFLMMSVEIKLIVFGFGWRGVDVSSLTRSLSGIRTQLQSLAAIAEPSLG
jgi:hypothetical protein